jgi:hypothetical protein
VRGGVNRQDAEDAKEEKEDREMGDDKDKGTAPLVQPKTATRVRVLVDNLGPRLYMEGQVTDDPEIVALIGDERNLVEPVK